MEVKRRAIDAGGSVTRIAKSRKDVFKIPSNCMEIGATVPSKGHIIENKALDFMFKKSPCSGLEGRRFVKAEAMNQYRGDTIVCDNSTSKVLQEITYINILYALAVDSLRRGLNDQNYRIGVCIPAAEFYDDVNDRVNEAKSQLAGSTAIYFPMLDKTVRFTIDTKDIAVTPEGVVAAFRFKRDRDFVTRTSVVIDVGYRSTDITVLIKMSPVGASAASRPIGGINLEAAVQSQLERDNIFVNSDVIQAALSTQYVLTIDNKLIDITGYVSMAKEENYAEYKTKAVELAGRDGILITEEEVEAAVMSHYIVQGQDVIEITSYVHQAKEVFIDAVFRAAQAVVNAKMMNIADISNVLCVGRPFDGDPADPHCMVNMLKSKFKEDVMLYAVPDAGTANVVEIIEALGTDE